MHNRRRFSDLTPVTPPTRQPRDKQPRFNSPQTPHSRIRILTHATPPSHHIRQLFSQQDDNGMDIDIQPRRLFGEALQNVVQNIGDDVFGGHTNPGSTPPPVPINMEAGLRNHDPAHIVQGVRHTFHGNRFRGHRARDIHPLNPDKLWCTSSGHWVHKNDFGLLLTCEHCREMSRARAAAAREQERAQAAHAQAQAEMQRQLEAQLSIHPDPLLNDNNPPPQSQEPEPAQPPPITFDDTSAISAEDKTLLNNCRERLMAISMETCDLCHEEWFDLKVQGGICEKCRKSSKWQPSNNMYPGPGANHLPELTQMEEMLISPVHALIQLWQIRGGQYKYTGHTCNFPRDNVVFHSTVPLLPEECDIIIMRRAGDNTGSNEAVHQDFRVRRGAIQAWLQYLEVHHPTFQSRQVTVDYQRINQLPENGLVHNQLRNIENQYLDDVFQDVGPPEASDNHSEGHNDPLYSAGFAPNMRDSRTEEEQLRQAALNSGDPIILPMPSVRGTPISEYSGRPIAIDAFPTLFPTGEADFEANRALKVDMKEWAVHLLHLKGGRFARHPRFHYWVLNTIMRHTAKTASNWYLRTHKEDRELTVEDIRDMIEANDVKGLADRVSHAGAKLPGSKPFWQNAQRNLIAQIRAPDAGTPHVFFTCSSADIQWPDMHQHMPDYNLNVPEDATSYRTRMQNLNNNPAVAAYYFQKRWEVFFEEVIQKKFDVKDFWWRYEWQHRGSSHVHGFLWLKDAPSVDDFDRNNPEAVQNYINFWDQHISTWHPDKNCPPAAIHPSARLFNTLDDTKQELAEILNRLQRHTHCAPGYCERKKKSTGEIFCRFGYPKALRENSELAKDPGRDFAELNTRRNDELLNSYNSTFILGWRANIDFRPVINKEAVIAYVAKYASKGETSSSTYQDSLQKAIRHLQNSDAAGVAYQKMLSSFTAERDISSQETCHILHDLPLVRSSRQYRNLSLVKGQVSEEVNFASSAKERKSVLDRYKERPIDRKPELANVSLWEFATGWDWNGGYHQRGSRGAKKYVINLWPRYQPDRDEPEIYENYCYAKLLLHHPFINDPDSLLSDHLDWTAAYQSDCLDKHHNHDSDPLPNHVEGEDDDADSDSESVHDEDHDDENWRAEWMQEAGRRPNQSVEVNFANLGARDIDLAYNWVEHSPGQAQIDAAAKWLMDIIKNSPNDDAQDLPAADYGKLKGQQRNVFLQVMAYFKKIRGGGPNKPDPIRINIDGTAGTGKSFLIWCITHALKDLFEDELQGRDPVVRLAPTGVAAFGIRGWTVNYGLMIPVKEGKDFNQLGQNSLSRLQTRWKDAKLLIMDEKSMIGRTQMGRADRRLRQIHPSEATEILGGMPALIFGDFAQLPPVGDTPLYSDKSSSARTSLSQEGRMVFEHFNQSITLDTIFRQAGEDDDQIAFRDALMHLRTYSTRQKDYNLLATRFWDVLTPAERLTFEDVIHLLPTRDAVLEFNCRHLSNTGQPIIRCKAKHNHSEAKKASDDDADGLVKEVLLAEGAKVMLTRNLWTSKGNLAYVILINNLLKFFAQGLVNGAQGIVKKIWFHQGSNPRSHLPAVVFVKFNGYTGKIILMILMNIVLCS